MPLIEINTPPTHPHLNGQAYTAEHAEALEVPYEPLPPDPVPVGGICLLLFGLAALLTGVGWLVKLCLLRLFT